MVILTTKYLLFAGIATIINLSLQYVTLQMAHGEMSLFIAISFGTLGGLITKYILDKKYIFFASTDNVKQDFKLFLFYSSMGVVTTILFWGTEVVFHYLIPHDSGKYIGAVIGLSMGYVIKYHLDKAFVFPKQTCKLKRHASS